MPVDHYENFPVASILLPARFRAPVQSIYAFARAADDLADEGECTDEARLAALVEFGKELDCIKADKLPSMDLFVRLAEQVRDYQLPLMPMRDLLSAFSQDVQKGRYSNYTELLDYCRRSANPVGRLLLHLYGRTDPMELAQADAICTALQLINFWQDIAIDWQKNRVYLPLDEMVRFGVTEAQIAGGDSGGNWWPLMRFQIERAHVLLHNGAPLGRTLPGRIGLELRLVVAGGDAILHKLVAVRGDVFRARPVLRVWDWPILFLRALSIGQGKTTPIVAGEKA